MTIKLLVKPHLFLKMKKNRIWMDTDKSYRYFKRDEAVILELTIYCLYASFAELLYKYCCDCESFSTFDQNLLDNHATYSSPYISL